MGNTVHEAVAEEGSVAAIHLYGKEDGKGYCTIVCVAGREGVPPVQYGDGQSLPKGSMTDAISSGVEVIKSYGVYTGTVEVHYDFPLFGLAMATFDLAKPAPYFGELSWGAGRASGGDDGRR